MSQRQRSSPRGTNQLPPGRNPRGREFVAENQRQRILDAVADVVSLVGYGAMTVEEVVGSAGVSRRTFYDLFTDKQEAFLAALDEVVEEIDEIIRTAFDLEAEFATSARQCLGAFLGFVIAQPHLGEMLLVETLAAGPEAIERRRGSLAAFAGLLDRGAQRLDLDHRPPPLTAETVVGGIYEVLYSRLLSGETGELPNLLPDLTYSLLQPYIGHDAALVEAAKATVPAASSDPVV